MSRDASLTIDWADGSHTFRLGIREWEQIDETCEIGPLELFRVMNAGTWRFKHLREVIRLALIGGGMEPIKALSLVRTYVEQRPPLESALLCEAIVKVGVMGAPPDDQPQKKSARERKPRTTSPTADGAGAASTDAARS